MQRGEVSLLCIHISLLLLKHSRLIRENKGILNTFPLSSLSVKGSNYCLSELYCVRVFTFFKLLSELLTCVSLINVNSILLGLEQKSIFERTTNALLPFCVICYAKWYSQHLIIKSKNRSTLRSTKDSLCSGISSIH